jgi:hypothetical protein
VLNVSLFVSLSLNFNFAEYLVMFFFCYKDAFYTFLKTHSSKFFSLFLFCAKISENSSQEKALLVQHQNFKSKKHRFANNINYYLFRRILLFLSTKKLGNYCFPRVNLTKIFFFGGRICQIVHIPKKEN